MEKYNDADFHSADMSGSIYFLFMPEFSWRTCPIRLSGMGSVLAVGWFRRVRPEYIAAKIKIILCY